VIRYSDNILYKDLVAVAIEQTLAEIGKLTLEQVSTKLKEEYSCGFRECFEHPHYLHRILKDYYGNSYTEIINSIKKKLEEFKENESINHFLKVMK